MFGRRADFKFRWKNNVNRFRNFENTYIPRRVGFFAYFSASMEVSALTAASEQLHVSLPASVLRCPRPAIHGKLAVFARAHRVWQVYLPLANRMLCRVVREVCVLAEYAAALPACRLRTFDFVPEFPARRGG